MKAPWIMFEGNKIVLSQDNFDIDSTVLLKINGTLEEFKVNVGPDGSQYVDLHGQALDLELFTHGELE